MKYIKKKLIKNREYYYFEYYFKADGIKKTFTKYLGNILPLDLKSRFDHYFEEIASKVSEKISDKFLRTEDISTIEKSRFKYILINHELFENENKLFKTLFYILFVLNSNRSEGSKVTRPDIEEVIEKRAKPKTILDKEILNSIEAINFAFSNKMKWNEKSIKQIHKHLFWNIHPEIAGKYKKVNNIIGNSNTTKWEDVHKEMKILLVWLKNNKIYPPRLALEFHYRFEAIHPFEDGNGRVGRILLNTLLIQKGYSPVIFFSENHNSYCRAIEKARDGRIRNLIEHYVKSITKSEKAIESYRNEGVVRGGSPKIGRWEIQKGKIRVG